MSELAQAVLPRSTRERLNAVGRWATAVALGGVLAGAVFLIMVQGSHHKGYTDLDFNHSLGTLVGGDAQREASREALGVVGDSAGPTGFWVTALLGIALVMVHSLLVLRFARGRPWYLQAVPLWIVTALLLGLVYGPLVGSSVDGAEAGVFGIDAGGFTAVVLILCALGFALVAARTFGLAIGREWWEAKEESLEKGLEVVEGLEVVAEPAGAPSLELPEERGEDRGVSSRG